MRKEYKFSGDIAGTSIVLLEKDKITIKRKGFFSFMTHGLKGEKTIQISAITGVQYKPAGITIGYLQFILMGSQEVKGGIDSARKDENTVCWAYKKSNKFAEEIKYYIENYNSNRNKGNVVIKENDKYDQLSKIKKMLDDGILTQEEFEKEKRKILQ